MRQAGHLFVVDSLRFQNSPERRRTTQRQPSQKCLVAATHCEFSSGVNHWRTRVARAGLAERLRHILTRYARSGIPRQIFLGSFWLAI